MSTPYDWSRETDDEQRRWDDFVHGHPELDDDPLAPARGIAVGVAFGLAMWAATTSAILLVIR